MIDFTKGEFITSIYDAEKLPDFGIAEIALCGRSNVGKSSLINKLFNRKNLARVSAEPGKTACVNYYRAGQGLVLADLPGYGYAKRSHDEINRWAELIKDYFEKKKGKISALLLLDIRHAPSQNDMQMLEFLKETKIPFYIVLTKADKLSRNLKAVNCEIIENKAGRKADIIFSAKDGSGCQELKELLEKSVNAGAV